MKTIRIILEFFSESFVPTLVLFVIFSLSLMIVNITTAQYKYEIYSKTVFQNSGLNNAIYFMPFSSKSDSRISSWKDFNKFDAIKKQEAVKEVLTVKVAPCELNGQKLNLVLYNDELIQAFGSSSGLKNWSSSAATKENRAALATQIPQNQLFNSIQKLTVYNQSENKSEFISVFISGVMGHPVYTVGLGLNSSYVLAEDFLSPTDSVILKETPDLLDFLNQTGTLRIYPNCFVMLKDDISEQAKQSCMDWLKTKGNVLSYQEILSNTSQTIDDRVKKKFPIPLFFLMVATVSLISVSVLFVYKKMKTYSIYYLCGLSRKRSKIYMGISLSLISFAACLFNIFVMSNYYSLHIDAFFNNKNLIFDSGSILWIVGYSLLVFFISMLIPQSLIKSLSPIEINRRLDE